MSQMSPELIAIIAAVAGFLSVKVFDFIFDSRRKHEDLIKENTIAIVALQIEIKHLNEKLAVVHKMKDDVDAAHRQIRDIKGRVAHGSQ